MSTLALHLLVLAAYHGIPAFGRWCDYKYEMSTRWRHRA